MDNRSKKTGLVYQKGQQIRHYRIIGVIDKGQFINRYLVESVQGTQAMMMEVFLPTLLNDLKENFLTQTQPLKLLEHPNILRPQDAGVENAYAYLVNAYTSLVTLREKFPRGHKQSLQKIIPIVKQSASALQYMHDRKLIHGAIRPENIVMTGEEQVLLRGFLIDAITRNRERLNFQKSETVTYSAPELIQGKADPASDQYALAVTIYELLSGEAPFTGSYFRVANQHLSEAAPVLSQKAPEVAQTISGIVMKALEKRPEQRFGSVQEFVSELEREYNAPYKNRSMPGTPPSVSPPAMPPSVVTSHSAPTLAVPPPAPGTPPAGPAHRPAANVSPMSPVSPISSPSPHNAPVLPPLPVAGAHYAGAASSNSGSMPPTALSYPISPPAPRRGSTTMTRRLFSVGLIGLAMAGGVGGWYVLSSRLAKPAQPVVPPGDPHPPATATVVNTKNALIFTGHLAAVNALAWSPDGTFIASGSNDRLVQVFDSSSGARRLLYSGHTEEVASIAWSPNGKLLASGGQDKTAQVWDPASGKKVFQYTGHTDRINSVAWSRDSRALASASEDKSVQVWNTTSEVPKFDFRGHTAGVLCVSWQPNNSSLASGSWDGTVRDWAIVQHGNHFNAGDQIFNYGGHGKNEVYALSWSPDGNFLASAGADQVVQLSNATDGTPRPSPFTGHQSKTHSNPVRAVAWSPDGNFIASGDASGVVLVWTVQGRKVVFTYRGHRSAINALAWSPDGKRIASASDDTTVQVWQFA